MIDIKFTLEDCKITYECTYINDKLRNNLDFKTAFIENIFSIASIDFPEIVENILFLRGRSNNKDKSIRSIKFDCNDKRDTYTNQVKTAFEGLKVHLKKEHPNDYTEPKFIIEYAEDKTKDVNVKTESEYEYLTAEKLKELLSNREQYIAESSIKTIDMAVREQIVKGYNQFCLHPDDFKVEPRFNTVMDKVKNHFARIGVEVEWDSDIDACVVKVDEDA